MSLYFVDADLLRLEAAPKHFTETPGNLTFLNLDAVEMFFSVARV